MARRTMYSLVAVFVVVGGLAGYAFGALSGADDADVEPKPGVYSGQDAAAVLEQMEERFRGTPASGRYPTEIAEQIDALPPEERVEYRPVDCASIGLGDDPDVRGCITHGPSDQVRRIDPSISASDVLRWDGDAYEPFGIREARCEALMQVGYDGPLCEEGEK